MKMRSRYSGLPAFVFTPLENNLVEYSPAYGGSINKLSIFYSNQSVRKLTYTIRDTVSFDTTLYPISGLRKLDLLNLKSKSIKLSVAEPDSIQLYGVALEGPCRNLC